MHVTADTWKVFWLTFDRALFCSPFFPYPCASSQQNRQDNQPELQQDDNQLESLGLSRALPRPQVLSQPGHMHRACIILRHLTWDTPVTQVTSGEPRTHDLYFHELVNSIWGLKKSQGLVGIYRAWKEPKWWEWLFGVLKIMQDIVSIGGPPSRNWWESRQTAQGCRDPHEARIQVT